MKDRMKGGLDVLDHLCWKKGKAWKLMKRDRELKLMLREEKRYSERPDWPKGERCV
tara:strand:+ start:246 stop:413 length:168 start_codon:yes stop_codon:yes gene_type:complete